MNRILVVDDDDDVLRLVSIALADYNVTIAHDAHEAWLAAQIARPDLLITDYMMPEMLGDELIGTLRHIWPDLKVLILSAHAAILEREGDPLWQTEACLPKPFSVAALRDKVKELMAPPAPRP
jgi:CheY-like chemotaxis protein